jgi:DNA-binding CsgD family transcriptional regulator
MSESVFGYPQTDPAMTALLSAVSFAAVESNPRRRALKALSLVSDLLQARLVLAVSVYLNPVGNEMNYAEAITAGDWTPEQERAWFGYLGSEHGSDPFFEAMREHMRALPRGIEVVAFARGQLVDDDSWYQSEFFRSIKTPIGVDASIYGAVRAARPGWWIGAGFHRSLGAEQFTPQDAALAALFLVGARPLLDTFDAEGLSAGQFVARLTPRNRDLLFELLSGRSAKQVAARLGLTEATVHTYCKRLYRQIDVSGRSELVAKAHELGIMDAVVIRPRVEGVRTWQAV